MDKAQVGIAGPKPLSFEDTKVAFKSKSVSELKRGHFLFSAMGNGLLLKAGLTLMPLALKLKLPFTKGLIKSTIFKQFVGGETLAETATVADKLGKFNVQVILDYGVEGGDDGEEGFDASMQEFIKVISYAATQTNVPFISVKVTGLVRFTLLENIHNSMQLASGTLIGRYQHTLEALSEAEKQEWQRAVQRLTSICTTAMQKNIGVLIDAEESWIQHPVDAITMKMMDDYNKERPVIYNTIQLYRHDRLQFLKDCLEAAVARKFMLAVKLVRGAYMEKERRRAAEMGYLSPIQVSKENTDKDYNAAVDFCLHNLQHVAVIVATHNEFSNLNTTNILDQLHLPHQHPRVHFSQLYGMSDNITFNLAESGCSVSKYLPFGPIEDVVPYLLRRAQENKSVAGQTGRELGLIKKELARRNQERP